LFGSKIFFQFFVQTSAARYIRAWAVGFTRTDKGAVPCQQRQRAALIESFSAHIDLFKLCVMLTNICTSFAHPEALISEAVTCETARCSDERRKRPEKILKVCHILATSAIINIKIPAE
jgi:hypothetical protein